MTLLSFEIGNQDPEKFIRFLHSITIFTYAHLDEYAEMMAVEEAPVYVTVDKVRHYGEQNLEVFHAMLHLHPASPSGEDPDTPETLVRRTKELMDNAEYAEPEVSVKAGIAFVGPDGTIHELSGKMHPAIREALESLLGPNDPGTIPAKKPEH